MTDIKIVVTDLDGTLLRSDKSFSEKDMSMLKRLGAADVCRVIATGRSVFSAEKVLPSNFPVDYLIFSSGNGIMRWEDREIILKHQFNDADVRKIIALLARKKLDFMVHKLVPDNHLFWYSQGEKKFNADFERRLEIYKDYSEPLPDIDDIASVSQIVAIVSHSRDADSPAVYQELSRLLSKRASVIRATSPLDHRSSWIEIFPQKVSKGKTLSWLCDHLGIDIRKSVGIGNDYNDQDFLQITQHSFVVDNAPEQLKKMFRVTAHHDANGFSTALEMVNRSEYRGDV